MNETLDWHDLQLFLAVANANGLAGAVRITGLSAPTLGRRMTALEQAVGCELFVRRQSGYELTEDGQQLLEHVRSMQEASTGVTRWQEQRDQHTVIKITAGAWTSRFIAQNLDSLPTDTCVRLVPDNNFLDLRRREAHLAIRNRRPTQQGLAVQKLGRLAFAVYGAPRFASIGDNMPEMDDLLDICPWITYDPASAPIPSTLWLRERLNKQPALSCSSPTLVLDAATAGAGLCVVPCFVGDSEPNLRRLSAPIEELTHIQLLVSHDEDRHLKPVRQAAKALHKLFTSNKSMFSGESPRVP